MTLSQPAVAYIRLSEIASAGIGEKDRQREVVVFVHCVINLAGEWVA